MVASAPHTFVFVQLLQHLPLLILAALLMLQLTFPPPDPPIFLPLLIYMPILMFILALVALL